MLKLRLLTAAIMIVVLLGAIFLLPVLMFDLFMAVILLIGAWEWSTLSGLQSRIHRAVYVLLLFALLYLFMHLPERILILMMLPAIGWWTLALIMICRYPAGARLWHRKPVLLLAGLLVLLPGWAAIVHLSLQENYRVWIIICLSMIAFADSGAYFAGRFLGKTSLAPMVSPNKTWEGVFGGLLACAVLACSIAALSGVETGLHPALVALAAIVVAASSIVGDLFESMIKRQSGVKDSGSLLPGHGGVLDRLDSITAALPIFILLLVWMDLL